MSILYSMRKLKAHTKINRIDNGSTKGTCEATLDEVVHRFEDLGYDRGSCRGLHFLSNISDVRRRPPFRVKKLREINQSKTLISVTAACKVENDGRFHRGE